MVVWRVSGSELSVVRLSLYTSLQSVRLFLLCLPLFWSSVPLFPFSLSSTITLRPLTRSILVLARSISHVDRLLVGPVLRGHGLLHFDSRTITSQSPRGQTSTAWLVVWGRDYRNRAHAIKVWQIYIHIYIYIQTRTDNTARLVASR